ncbi:MAG: hypothetical protein OJF49_000854 [Ktedonobacterales bacterium]|nr:MAG: hypothetical protein OJF49_000854 [Ktedonobacterales bacterium]
MPGVRRAGASNGRLPHHGRPPDAPTGLYAAHLQGQRIAHRVPQTRTREAWLSLQGFMRADRNVRPTSAEVGQTFLSVSE